MAPATAFQKDEKALCYHMDLLYECKVLDTRHQDPDDKKSPFEYKVHYKNWKNTWDEWVTEERLRKNTSENQMLAQDLRKEVEAHFRQSQRDKKKKPGANSSRRESEDVQSAAGNARGTKRGRDMEVEREEQFATRHTVRIVMPDRLKSVLVDDWENVTKHLMLVQLPSKTPVSQIIKDYIDHEGPKREAGSASQDQLHETVGGMAWYFRSALGKLLLYKFERVQYQEIVRAMQWNTAPYYEKNIEDIYGAEHLLRLLSMFPELIAKTNIDRQSMQHLREEIIKFQRWLEKDDNFHKYFSVPYQTPDKEYTDKAAR